VTSVAITKLSVEITPKYYNLHVHVRGSSELVSLTWLSLQGYGV